MTADNRIIDINADVGLGFEGENSAHDEKVIKRLTSANIACGFQGGDPAVMLRSVDYCVKYEVEIGASVGIPALMGFDTSEDFDDMHLEGMSSLGSSLKKVSAKKVYAQVIYQLGALMAFATARKRRVAHLKPHGALYEAACCDTQVAKSIAQAVSDVDPSIIIIAPAGSELQSASVEMGLKVRAELVVQSADLISQGMPADIDSIGVVSSDDYAVMLIDEILRALRKENITVQAQNQSQVR